MLWSRSGGRDDGPLLVLLHGLGGTAEVWRGVEALLPGAWPGGWLAVDLPGHGRSPWAPPYTFDAQAAAVADLLPSGRVLVLMGHSMGGMVALALAAGRPQVRRVVGFSIKTFWPPSHVEGMQAQARRAPRVFDTRDEAIARYARLAGLEGLVPPGDDALLAGVTEVDGGWRVAQDPATYDFGVPDMPALLADAACPVTLARGSEDEMVRDDNVRGLVDDPVTFEGLGHNPHVEQPSAVVALLSL
ncbi:MAG TPA: alpha/beta fold hydrolase [Intrasporangium sp.]|nr:alpha/beta fold hydrolase [Intrasporangium sp.]